MVALVDRVLSLVDAVYLLLQLLPPIRQLHLYVVYVLGDAFNVEDVVGGVYGAVG